MLCKSHWFYKVLGAGDMAENHLLAPRLGVGICMSIDQQKVFFCCNRPSETIDLVESTPGSFSSARYAALMAPVFPARRERARFQVVLAGHAISSSGASVGFAQGHSHLYGCREQDGTTETRNGRRRVDHPIATTTRWERSIVVEGRGVCEYPATAF